MWSVTLRLLWFLYQFLEFIVRFIIIIFINAQRNYLKFIQKSTLSSSYHFVYLRRLTKIGGMV